MPTPAVYVRLFYAFMSVFVCFMCLFVCLCYVFICVSIPVAGFIRTAGIWL